MSYLWTKRLCIMYYICNLIIRVTFHYISCLHWKAVDLPFLALDIVWPRYIKIPCSGALFDPLKSEADQASKGLPWTLRGLLILMALKGCHISLSFWWSSSHNTVCSVPSGGQKRHISPVYGKCYLRRARCKCDSQMWSCLGLIFFETLNVFVLPWVWLSHRMPPTRLCYL